MRAAFLFLVLLSVFGLAFAWSKEDHEIFDLVSALESAEGKGVNFYTFLNVTPTANTDQINKAYRKRSLALHPDKNRDVPDIQARFARLGVITNILRNQVKRERYDHFLKNGFPRWRGTGYYYARFRPSVWHVLVFIILISSVFHYVILRMNEKKDQERVAWFERRARELAFPGLGSGGGGSLSANGSGTSTPTSARAGKAEVVANVMDQLESTTTPGADSTTEQEMLEEPKLTRRQARSREGRKELNKWKEQQQQQQAERVKPGPPAPVIEAGGKRRKVKVPYSDVPGGPSLELIVTGEGQVTMPGDIPLRSQIRSASLTKLWPIALAQSLINKVAGSAAASGEPEDVESDEQASEILAQGAASKKNVSSKRGKKAKRA